MGFGSELGSGLGLRFACRGGSRRVESSCSSGVEAAWQGSTLPLALSLALPRASRPGVLVPASPSVALSRKKRRI